MAMNDTENTVDDFFRKASSCLSVYKVRFAGMGFMWAWFYCCWFTSALYPGSSGFTLNASSSWLVGGITFAVVLVVAPLAKKEMLRIGWVRIVAVSCIVGGTLAMALGSTRGGFVHAAENFGAVATGVGNGLLWLMWSDVYSRLKTEIVEIAIPLSALVVPVCIFIVHDLAGPVALTALCALPVISLAMLLLSCVDEESFEHVDGQPMERRVFWPEFMRIGIAAVAIHAAIAAVWALISATYHQVAGGWIGLPVLVGALAAVAVSLLLIFLSSRPDIFTMYRYFLPIMVVALAFLSLGTLPGESIACALIMVCQLGYSIILYVFFSKAAHAGWGPEVVCLGLSRAFIQIGIVAGTILAHRASPLINAGELSLEHTCIFLACLCVVPSLLLLNRESTFRYGPQNALHGISAQTPAPAPQAMAESSSALPSAATIEENCGRIAVEAGLSPREREVFTLLAQGRSIPYVRDVLQISKNTADTHAKNIYRKLGIHSRQELIDLAQSYDCDRGATYAGLP